MKVFLSWSGDLSHKVAVVLRDWLPSVIQSIEPYVSSEDIDKGARWSTDIAKELEASAFGVLCVTQENLESPWLNFEAGALSKTVDKSRVCPFLYGVKRSEIKGPLLQFQSTILEEADVKKLVGSLNAACDAEHLEDTRLERAFEVWWPRLEGELSRLPSKGDSASPADAPTRGDGEGTDANSDILEEILELVRTQQKLLRSPEELLPRKYVAHVLRTDRWQITRHPAWNDLWQSVEEAERYIKECEEPVVPTDKMRVLIDGIVRPTEYIHRRTRDRSRQMDLFDES